MHSHLSFLVKSTSKNIRGPYLSPSSLEIICKTWGCDMTRFGARWLPLQIQHFSVLRNASYHNPRLSSQVLTTKPLG